MCSVVATCQLMLICLQRRAHILSMDFSDAYKFFEMLVAELKTRSASVKHAIRWIYHILVNHGCFIISQELSAQLLLVLQKIDKAKNNAIQAPLAEHHGDGVKRMKMTMKRKRSTN